LLFIKKKKKVTCTTSSYSHAKRLHTFTQRLGKFKEGKLIAGYLQKPGLTQEVPTSRVVKRQKNLLRRHYHLLTLVWFPFPAICFWLLSGIVS